MSDAAAAAVGGGFALGGVVLTVLATEYRLWRDRDSQRRQQDRDLRRQAYAEFLAAAFGSTSDVVPDIVIGQIMLHASDEVIRVCSEVIDVRHPDRFTEGRWHELFDEYVSAARASLGLPPTTMRLTPADVMPRYGPQVF